MRTLLIMAVIASFSTSYAAPVPDGDVVLSINDEGEPVGSPWTLSAGGADAPLPAGLSIGGRAVFDVSVYPQGILVFNAVGFDADAPRPLADLLMGSVVAPFWATLAPAVCGDVPAGTVELASGPNRLTIIWRAIPLSGCRDDGQSATFSTTLAWDDEAVIRSIEFRYETLPAETLELEPRAGFRLHVAEGASAVFELLPDQGGIPLRGRAKLLLDGTSDGESGAWLIELSDAGQIVGEREPQHFEDDGETRRRPDGWREADNCPDHHNPLQEDFDADGRGDVCDDDADGDLADDDDDNCLWLANRDQADLDDDGVGDACDADDDGDGWPDVFDRCPVVAHPSNGDLDRDGRGDVCDFDADADDPWAEIFRRFGFDRCPLIFDPLRMDRDWDGLGDACDLRPDTPCIDDCLEQADTDGDGVSDALDVCPLIHDPRQFDADGDGRGNVCDPDANGDGVVDLYQVCEWGLCAGGMNLPRLPGAWSF